MNRPVLPLRQQEATQLQFLLGLIGEGERAKEILARRLAATGDCAAFAQAIGVLGVITDRLLATVDPGKLRVLRKNLLHQELRIVTKSPADDSRYDWTLVPAPALRTLCATAARWECKVCDGGPCEMAACGYRKTLKQLLMFDLDDEYGECFARRLDWEE